MASNSLSASEVREPAGPLSVVAKLAHRPSPPPSEPASSAFDDSLPFLFFGGVCVLTAIWLFVSNPVPGNPLPLWTLLLGVGVIALAGGIVGIFVAEPRSPRPARARARSARPISLVESHPEDAVAAPPVRARAAPARTRAAPREIVNLEAEASDFMGLGSLARSPAPRTGMSYGTPDDEELAPAPESPTDSDDVLRSIEELSDLIRQGRSGPAAPRSGPVGPSVCGSCGSPVAGSPAPVRCQSCHTLLCPACVGLGQRDGHPGSCSTCALLAEVESSDRASRSPAGRVDEGSLL